MNLIDMHCDTLMHLIKKPEQNLYETDCSISVPGMKKAGTLAQFFACFTYLKEYAETGGYEDCYKQALAMISCMKTQVAQFSEDIAFAHSYAEIMKNRSEGKISAVLTVEEGGILNGEIGRLDMLYDKGVRLMTLMWNYENCLGHPNHTDPEIMRKGLTPFGIEVVERMGELGMIVDVSHASDGTFYDVLKYAKSPVVATHSNCRDICPNPRNLSDEMIRALAEKGGVSGLNFYGAFLGTKGESRIDEMVQHILRMIDAGGKEFPAIGTDFDGIDGLVHMDIPDVSQMEKLWDALKKKGVPESQLELIWSGNVLRILKELI